MSLLEQERFARLQNRVDKVKAKNPEELFKALPGLRRYFEKSMKEAVDVITRQQDGTYKTTHEKGYKAKYRGLYPDDLVKIIKYIVFVYDPESDLVNEYPDDAALLKDAALREAGYEQNEEGEWPDYVQEFLHFKVPEVSDWIVDYLKIKKNSVWTEIKFIEEEIDSLTRQRQQALLRGEVKNEIMKLVKERNEEREKLYAKFYGSHRDLRNATEEDIIPVSPENVFKAMQFPEVFTKVTQIKDVSQPAQQPAI